MAETPLKHIAQPADGSKFEYSTDGTLFTEVKELRSMQMPRKMRGKVPASTLNTPGRFKRKRKGWKDSDDLEIRVAATAVGIALLDSLYEDQGPDLWFRHTYPDATDGSDGGSWKYQGWISTLRTGDVTVETDELVDCTFTVCVNSTPIYTPPTP